MTEAKPKTVITNQEALCCRFLPNGVITEVNQTYCNYFHKSPDELIGTNFKQSIPPEASQTVEEFFSSFTPLKSFRIVDHPVLLPDGRFRWLKWAEQAFYDNDGQIKEFLAVGQDITEAKENEIKLEEREKSFSQLVETSPLAISIHDGEKILFLNQAGIELLGAQTADQIIGKSVLDFVHPHYRPMVKERMRMAIEKGETTPMQDIKLMKITGEEMDVETTTGPIRFIGKMCVQVYARDVTKIKGMTKAFKDNEIALRQLWRQFEVEKLETQTSMLANATEIILPILEKGKTKGLSGGSVREVIKHLVNFISPFGKNITSKVYGLSGKEIEVCVYIRNNKSNKEIAKVLKVSLETVERHRNNIRKKFGLVKKDVNLNVFLQRLGEKPL